MIPKIIHYCWFGNNPKPKLAQKCIKSWKKYLKGYKIIEWNESNYNFDNSPQYVKDAYKEKKWAFVTDYVRIDVVYKYGGIYLDVDVEIIKSLDSLLTNTAYFGFDDNMHINTGFGFGAEKGNSILYDLIKDYTNAEFVKNDGTLDLTPCPQRNTKVFVKHGLKKNGKLQYLSDQTLILPQDYLCPLDYYSMVLHKTSNTVSIHHFNASWRSEKDRRQHLINAKKYRNELFIDYIIHLPNKILLLILGNDRYSKFKTKFK